MRIINGLKYTVVDQFKVLAITIASVFVVFLGIVAIYASPYATFRAESYSFFIAVSFVLMVFMGISYTPIYFRTLIQGGFTRKEIFIIQIITDVIILFSGGVLVALSILPTVPAEAWRLLPIYFNSNVFIILALGTLASRTLFNCVGLIINKFNNRFASGAVGITIYFLFGALSRAGAGMELDNFFKNYGILFSILYLATLLAIEFFIMQTHNSKPITK